MVLGLVAMIQVIITGTFQPLPRSGFPLSRE